MACGQVLRRSAMASRFAWLWSDRSVPLGRCRPGAAVDQTGEQSLNVRVRFLSLKEISDVPANLIRICYDGFE